MQRRPFPVDDRKPGCVAVAALDHIGLAEDPFELKPKPGRGGTRRRVQRVAFPLISAITEFVECAPHHQIHGLGRSRAPLQQRRVGEAADLDCPSARVDAQVAPDANRLATADIDDRVDQRIVLRGDGLHIGEIFVEPVERPPRQIGPHPPLAVEAVGRPEVSGVLFHIEEFEAAKPALHRCPRRLWPSAPVGDHWADRLAE